MSKETPVKKLLTTGITSFDEILDGGLCYLDTNGLFGVIFGVSGSGKSVLGIQMCCCSETGDNVEGIDKKIKFIPEPYSWAIYISQETPEVIKNRIEGFCFFGKMGGKIEFSETLEEVIENINSDTYSEKRQVYLVHLPVGHKNISQTLHNVFELAGSAKHKPLICIDNANLIERDGWMDLIRSHSETIADSSVEPKQTIIKKLDDFLFYKNLHEAISKTKIPTFLIFEEDHRANKDILTRPESYAADVVVQLGFKTYPAGYSERFLDVIKVKNQFYYRGQNHCSIVGKQGGGRKKDISDNKDYGIIIYPQIATQLTIVKKLDKEVNKNINTSVQYTLLGGLMPELSLRGRHRRERMFISSKKQIRSSITDSLVLGYQNLGIPPLDKQISKEANTTDKYLTTGSTNVLVSDLDSKATEIGLHFATQDKCNCLYVSLLHDIDKLKKMATRFGLNNNLQDIEKRLTTSISPLHCLWHLSPEYVSGHKLLHDIQQKIDFIQKQNISGSLVVVLDNVYELECKYPLLMETKTFLSALLDVLKHKRITSLIIDTVEAGEYKNPLESSFAAGLADNVFLLRHVEFQSRTHRVFSILKLAGDHTPDTLWDLDEKPDETEKGKFELIAKDTFALYKNVLSGKPEPIDITISLYKDQDGSPMHHYIEAQQKTLSQYFGEGLKVNTYGAEEHARMQNLLKIANSRRQTGCHIVALDEFWLKELIENNLLEEISVYKDIVFEEEKTIEKGSFVCAAHDLAIFNKCKGDYDVLKKELGKWYAIPARNNCGVLCFNPNKVRFVFERNMLIRNWFPPESDPNIYRKPTPITWDQFCSLKKDYDNTSESAGIPFFTFCMDQRESCVSFLLELCFSYETDDKTFYEWHDKEKIGEVKIGKLPPEALSTFTKLLNKADLEQVASGRFRSSSDEPRALFTRQWMSTLGCLRNRQNELAKDDWFLKLAPYELPLGYCKTPTPVSGTWYLGIIKDSIAIETGASIIRQFTSIKDEIYKTNNFIGLPVRENFYFGKTVYADHFRKLARIQDEWINNPNNTTKDKYHKHILSSRYPFYRMLIDEYPSVAAVLWRLMIKTATIALDNNPIDTQIISEQLIPEAQCEYDAIKR